MTAGPPVIILDTETTGVDPAADAICEIGALILEHDAQWIPKIYQTLVDPRQPIPAVASAVHHIIDAMVLGEPHVSEAADPIDHPGAIYVAHNARFDRAFVPWLDGDWICTMKVAAHLHPDAPSFGNQALSYWLGAQRPPKGSGHAHRALYDAWTTFGLFRLFRHDLTVADMIEISSRPILQSKIRFGKHQGTAWRDLPADYLEWMEKKGDWDEDEAYTLREELKRRRGELI